MFTVRWSPSALSDLAGFWADADTEGESRDGRFRILIVAPLGVEYAVFDDRRLAYVVRVWQFQTPN